MTAPGDTVTVTAGVTVTLAVADLVGSCTLVAVTVTVCGLPSVAGAVYRPPLEIVPTAGLTDHVTAVFVVPVTVAVNCCVCDGVKLAVDGLTVTCMGGTMVTLAVAVLLVFATLVAVTVTVCGLPSVAGAEYRPPLETVPTAGFTDHVTAVFVVPVTTAENCCV